MMGVVRQGMTVGRLTDLPQVREWKKWENNTSYATGKNSHEEMSRATGEKEREEKMTVGCQRWENEKEE